MIAVVLLFRIASGDHVSSLFVDGRLASPTGYFNSTAALFTTGGADLDRARVAAGAPGGSCAACSSRSPARGCSSRLSVQSRGWLFTLPLVVIVALAVVPDRLRVAVAAAIPIAAALGPLHRLLDVYRADAGPRAEPTRRRLSAARR